jgi:MoaA/NifB/PqqE/SkfB family radical SAM enzyme
MCNSWRSNSNLTADVAFGIIEALFEDGWNEIVFTGGEFVGHPRALEIIQRASQAQLKLGYITNGTVFLDEFKGFLHVSGLKQVIYSRDFADGERHARFRALVNIDMALPAVSRCLSDGGVDFGVNTVLMPENVGELERFPDLPFWENVTRWQIIPVKGPMAKGWTDIRRDEACRTIERLRSRLTRQRLDFIDPLISGLGRLPSSVLQRSLYTEHLVGDCACTVLARLLYIDASGQVLPCNSISWEYRHKVGYGNAKQEDMKGILRRRRASLAISPSRDARACYACDPLNVRNNLDSLYSSCALSSNEYAD